MNRILKIIGIVIACALVGLSVPLIGCSEPESEVSENQIVTVQQGDLTIDIAAAGNLALSLTEDMAFEIAGTVEEVLVEEGDTVEEGQVLARLDTSEWDKELTNLEMDLVQADINLKNAELALKQAELENPNRSTLENHKAECHGLLDHFWSPMLRRSLRWLGI